MQFPLSVFFGFNQTYDFGGFEINFDNDDPNINVFGNTSFSKITNFCLTNPVIKVASFGYLHVLIHELGHALAAKLCGGYSHKIDVYTKTCQGYARVSKINIFISVAGPLLGIVWELAKLTAAIALAILLPAPIGIPLGILLGAGSIFWIFGEAAYACSKNGDWDFLN